MQTKNCIFSYKIIGLVKWEKWVYVLQAGLFVQQRTFQELAAMEESFA
ncbi:MAG: hypothetical protein RM368_20195 [Nostoc sp. DedSLP03]|nr:hypothetical protein [Nostoc sp. DedSLP03]